MTTTNIANRTIFEGDNLDVMRGFNSDSIDLIYLDPPYNSNKNYAAPIGSTGAVAAFKDTWTLSDVDNAWHGEIAEKNPALYRAIDASELTHGKGMKSYLIMMAIRLLEMRRILKPDGSIYLQCDPTASHYIKIIMDSIFGRENFQNEITWHYYNKYSRGERIFARNYDQIFFYAMGDYTFNPQREKRDKPTKQLLRENVNGVLKNKKDENGKTMYRMSTDKKVDAVWRIPCLQPASKEWTDYPTQKPLALLKRIILASSNEGDIILDPFCGCATTCIAAEQLERQWIGIDISDMASKLVKIRAEKELVMFGGIQTVTRKDIPLRTDVESVPNYRERKHSLFGQQEGLCAGCKIYFPFKNMTVDHIVPQSKAGTDHYENLQLLCNYCNSLKGNRSQEEFIVALKEKGLRD